MIWTYDKPLVIASPIGVAKIKHGVTEVSLTDGRLIRLEVHIDGVTQSAAKSDGVDVSYNVLVFVMAQPEMPVMDVHEAVQ